MKRLFVSATVLLAATFGFVVLGDELKSGLEPGSFPGAFEVLDCSGPAKGETLCYRCRFKDAAVVSVFSRNTDEKTVALLKELNGQLEKSKGLNAFFVLLTDDAKANEGKLTELASKNKIDKVPLTIFEGKSGPEAYEISEKAELTVLMWVANDVKVNRAYPKGKLDKDAIKAIMGDTSKILK
ncbi:MAG: hypothetical protein WD648_02840 [Planctomycetaceae bacterium]